MLCDFGHPNKKPPVSRVEQREHDPEKWVPVFPRDKREAFARRSCSNKKIERDDDSKKSDPALVHAHVGLLQPIYKRFPLGSDLCLKRRSDSFVEPEELVDRHCIKDALLHDSFQSWTTIIMEDYLE
jgi:hypothetical protein